MKKFTLKFSLWVVFIKILSVYELNSSKINFFVFEFRGLQKKIYYAKWLWQTIFHLNFFFVYFIKIIVYLVKNICFLIFSQRATRNFFYFTHFGNVRHSIFIPHWNFAWSSKHWNVVRFDQCDGRFTKIDSPYYGVKL